MSGRAAILTSVAVILTGCSFSIGDEDPGSAEPTVRGSEDSRPRPSLDRSLTRLRSGVARVAVTDCEGSVGSGSGFLLGSRYAATAAHVVEGSHTISVRVEGGVARGTVIGLDTEQDVALLELAHEVPGEVFDFAARRPRLQQRVGVLGYPLGLPLATTKGNVTAVDRRIETETATLEGLLQLSAAVDPGNSGGPVIDASGGVVGVVARSHALSKQDLTLAVPVTTAGPLLASYRRAPQPSQAPECAPYADLVTIESLHPDAPSIAAALHRYFDSINSDLYDAAWATISGDLRGDFGGFDEFAKAYSSTIVSDVVVEKSDMVDSTTDTADVRFTSTQAPELGPDEQTCTRWHLRYTLRLDESEWVIAGADALREPQPCD